MGTILIVDDDIDIVNLFKIFLSREGHIAVTASDGKSCLEKIRQVRPDLVLLDVMMAPMDGWETLAAIKENPETSTIPVVMITGKPIMEDDRNKYGELFHTYLLKPVRRPQLCDVVRTALSCSR
ncbi:MAG: response regulator PleD [Methanoregula sp. PtaU1.Bin051]|nr:MAG: response regulator PleD [Methanoregula sp. PtaU1.Bin051]